MKVNSSNYLTKIKPQLKELLELLLEEFEYASILAVDSKSKDYRVSAYGTYIGDDEILCSRGFVVKAYDNGEYAEYSFNEITEDVKALAETIITRVNALKGAVPEELERLKLKVLSDEPLTFSKSTEYELHPNDMGDEKIIESLSALRNKAKAMDERILDCNVSATYQQYSKLFLSRNRDMEQNVLWMTGMQYFMAKKGEEIKSYYNSYSNLGGAEVLKAMEEDIPTAVKKTLELLDCKPMVPGTYDCICTPEVTGMIVHEAFGHGVEMDMFVKKRALAEQYVGEYVASPLVNMHDGATAADQTATYFFDDDGVLAQDTLVIEKGILKQGISDSMAALRLGTNPTGNSRRENYKRKAYTRMTNTFFEAGEDKLEDMIKSISYGFMLENATSGMEDPKNWGIQCMVNIAREIKDGEFTGNIFSPIVLTGYVPDLLKSISMVSDEVKLGGGGFCGKGYKEWVKVSDGGPYIKAKIRLG